MLTVFSVCNGDKYSDYYPQRLQREVKKHLTIPHRFVCVTDGREIEGVNCLPMDDAYPGWWQKCQLFREGVATEQNLFMDLDVVITGSLDGIVRDYCGSPFSILTNWAASGWGGCQSSVMAWKDNYMVRQIYDLFDYESVSKRLHGDQCWITELRDTKRIEVNPIDPKLTASYKYHCRESLPKGCKIVVFHGDPKPADVREDWFTW